MPDAAAFIRQRGGKLYVWGSPVGPKYASVKWGASPPSESIDFEPFRDFEYGVDVHVDPELDLGGWLDVRLRRFPPRRLVLDWSGKETPFIGSS